MTKYSDTKLVCIRDKNLGYYRCSRGTARAIIASDQTTGWTYTNKGAWKRNGGKYISEPRA